MSYNIFEVEELFRTLHEPPETKSTIPRPTSASNTQQTANSRNTHSAFCQDGNSSILLAVSSNNYIHLFYQEWPSTSKRKKIQWFFNPEKRIESVCLQKSGHRAVLVTSDATVYILPILQMFKPDASGTSHFQSSDLAEIRMKLPHSTKPTAVASWCSFSHGKDVALIGTEAGEVAVVDLLMRREVTRVRIGDAVVSLETVEYGKYLTYLLISTVSNVQFGLLLEQHTTCVPSLTSSMAVEVAELEYEIIKTADTAVSILDTKTSFEAFKPMRFDQFMRTVHLSCQTIKGRRTVIARSSLSNILKVYDASIDNWMPLFVYNIPISSDHVLLTDHFIFSVSKEEEKESKLLVLSSQFSETSDREHAVSSDAIMQELKLCPNEQILAMYRQYFPPNRVQSCKSQSCATSCSSSSAGGTGVQDCLSGEGIGKRDSPLTPDDLSAGNSEHPGIHEEKDWEGTDVFDALQPSAVEGCVIVTDQGMYQCKPRVNAEELFFQLLYEENDKAAEILGITLELNMAALYRQTAENKLKEGKVYEAMKFFRLSRSSSLTRATLLAKYGFLEEALSTLEGALSKQGELNHEQCKRVAELTVKCFILLSMKDEEKRKEILEKLNTFLIDNFDYDEEVIITVLAKYGMWDIMLEMAKARGHLLVAMEILLTRSSFPLDPVISEMVQSPTYLPAFVRAGKGMFLRKLSQVDRVRLLLTKPELALSNLQYIEECIPVLRISDLVKLAIIFDPTEPLNRPAFDSDRGRSVSLSSISSSGSFYGDGSVAQNNEQFILPHGIEVIRCFISVLLTLAMRRKCKDYDISEEPLLGDLEGRLCQDDDSPLGILKNPKLKRNVVACGRYHAGLVTSGELYTWGKSLHGRLGHGSILPKEGWSPPQRVETLHMHHLQVVSISCGKEHSVALTSNGKLYAWGNSRFGQLGTGEYLCHTHPVLIESLAARQCVEIVCGQYHTLARTHDHRVYSWGWGVHGQLGHGDAENHPSPKLISALTQKNIIQLGAAACHSGALSVDGKLWMFGCNTFGQLGTGSTEKVSIPLQLVKLASEPVKLFACGFFHNVAVTSGTPEKVFVWGHSPLDLRHMLQISRKMRAQAKRLKGKYVEKPHGQDKQYLEPQILNTKIESSIRKVVSGSNHNLLLTTSGDLYSWGKNIFGQLGLNNKGSVKTPTLLPAFASQAVADVAAGIDFSVAVNHYGEVFTWGSSAQLGFSVGSNESDMTMTEHGTRPVFQPVKVPHLPTVTIPAEFMVTEIPDNVVEDIDFLHDSNNLVGMPKSDLQPLLDSLGTFSLAQPQHAIVAYGFHSSTLIFNHLRSYYKSTDILSQCVASALWEEAAQLCILEENYISSLRYNLKNIDSIDDIHAKIEKAVQCASTHISLIKKKFKKSQACVEEQEDLAKQFLLEVFQHWAEASLQVEVLEQFLSQHLSFLASQLSILIFSPDAQENHEQQEASSLRDNFSTTFCLKLTSQVVTSMKQGKISSGIKKLLEMENPQTKELPSPTRSRISSSASFASLSENAALEEIERSSLSSIGMSVGISLSSEQVAELVTSAKSNEEKSKILRAVVFTCGHHRSHSSFLSQDLVEFDSRVKSFNKVQLNTSASLILRLYRKEGDLIPVGCPQCVLEEIRAEVEDG